MQNSWPSVSSFHTFYAGRFHGCSTLSDTNPEANFAPKCLELSTGYQKGAHKVLEMVRKKPKQDNNLTVTIAPFFVSTQEERNSIVHLSNDLDAVSTFRKRLKAKRPSCTFIF